MHRIILAAALILASAGASAEITCDKPEYLQLKTADKAELTDEYCRTTRMYELNLRMRRTTEDGIAKLRSMGSDVSKHLTQSEADMNAAMTCSKAAAEYAGAIERRFKTKPPAARACVSSGKQ